MSLWAAKLMYNSNAKGRHTPTEASVASGVYCQHGRDATLHCEGDTHPWCRSHTFGACRPPPHLGGTPAKNNHRLPRKGIRNGRPGAFRTPRWGSGPGLVRRVHSAVL